MKKMLVGIVSTAAVLALTTIPAFASTTTTTTTSSTTTTIQPDRFEEVFG